MLAANVCAAEFLAKHKIPTPYRVHAGPEETKLKALREFLSEFGYNLGGGSEPHASDYAAVLEQVAGRPEARLVQTVMLRSLSQAIYSTEEVGHFALAYERYAHFTSPIRRYPDLMVHRAIKTVLESEGKKRGLMHRIVKAMTGVDSGDTEEEIRTRSEHCSVTGRRADEASWDVIKWLKTEFMLDKIGEEYEGIITGVTNFGLFVELKEIHVEGLVHVTSLGNDYYHFDAEKHRLLGERTGQSFRLTDEVKIKVARVDLDEARIDFELVEKLASHFVDVPPSTDAQRKPQGKKKKTGRKRGGKKKTARGADNRPQDKKQGKKSGKKKSGSRRRR